jgi:hypothetical protein
MLSFSRNRRWISKKRLNRVQKRVVVEKGMLW